MGGLHPDCDTPLQLFTLSRVLQEEPHESIKKWTATLNLKEKATEEVCGNPYSVFTEELRNAFSLKGEVPWQRIVCVFMNYAAPFLAEARRLHGKFWSMDMTKDIKHYENLRDQHKFVPTSTYAWNLYGSTREGWSQNCYRPLRAAVDFRWYIKLWICEDPRMSEIITMT